MKYKKKITFTFISEEESKSYFFYIHTFLESFTMVANKHVRETCTKFNLILKVYNFVISRANCVSQIY